MNEVLVRQIPQIVHEIDAVLRRMHPSNPKRSILEELRRNFMSGYNGEKQIDYYLKNLKKENCFIFAGIRLELDGQAFQIDTLIVTPFFILIIESKNIAWNPNF
ncbi:nuclease-related domain-containing protein [Bacillus sp. T3]|uniref:nuclease-related domain-containing protein n=1 Tax=Bacillus sp. T3 TaxID=467262 RepID=UPI002981BD5C|nr:nuclease-related domain-containing protein [Bacillus sp. T3]